MFYYISYISLLRVSDITIELIKKVFFDIIEILLEFKPIKI